jgi:hypothetical protein
MQTDQVKYFNDAQAIAKENVVIFSFQDADNYIVSFVLKNKTG